jgi:hypothetical protein
MFLSEASNSFGGPPRGLSVQKRSGGAFSELHFDNTWVYTPGERWRVAVTCVGGEFDVHITQLDGDVDNDGKTEYDYSFTDSNNPLLTGKIGMTVWGSEAECNETNSLLGGQGLNWTENFDEGAVFDNVVVSTPGTCLGDLTGDGKIDQSDLGLLLAAYGTCPGQPGYNAAAGALAGPDPCVNQADLGVLLSVYGTTCP